MLNVGFFPMDLDILFTDAPEDQLHEAFARHGYTGVEQIHFQVNTLYIRSGDHHILLDPNAGLDYKKREPDRLLEKLSELELTPADIDTVIISHFHPDHYTGCVDADCNPLFSNAEYVVERIEWESWDDPNHPEAYFAEAYQHLAVPIRDRFRLLDGDQQIIDGLEAIFTPGHSAGHMTILIDNEVIAVADVFINMIHLEHPEWMAVFERDRDALSSSRRKVLDMILERDLIVYGEHYPWPGLGRLRKIDERAEWVPLGE